MSASRVWILSAFFLFSTYSQAAVVRDCSKAESNLEAKTCIAENYQDSLVSMKEELAAAQERLKKYFIDEEGSVAEVLGRLEKSQKAWEGFQEAQCQLEGISMLKGTGEELIVLSCLLDSTQKRIEELKDVGNYF